MSNDEMTTQPTIDTLLARLEEWGARLHRGQEELRADLNAGLRRIERKIEILNDNLLTTNADVRDLEVRMEKLEDGSLVKS